MAATTGRGAGTVTRGVDTGALVRAKQWHSSVPRGPVENEFGDRDRQRVRDRPSAGTADGTLALLAVREE